MMIFKYAAVIALASVLSACSGGGGGASKSVTNMTAAYSPDGTSKNITTTYSDGTSATTTLTGELTTPSYSADGSQKTLVYSYSDGSTHNGATLPGTLTNTAYSTDGSQELKTYTFPDTLSYTAKLEATGSQTNWANDHETKTITYSFADGNSHTYITTVLPATVAPVSNPAVYPADWSTGNSTIPVTPPTTTPKQDVYGDGYVKQVWEDGTAAKPFQQATLTPNGATGTGAINDPNANVLSPLSIAYDLRWGTPDAAGPAYVRTWFGSDGNAQAYTFPSALSIAGHRVSGQSSQNSGMTLGVPVSDVKAAWSQGWTGMGQNVLMIDAYPDPVNKPATLTQQQYIDYYTHGITTYLLASHYAPASNYYLFDGNDLNDNKAHSPATNAVATFQANSHGTLSTSVRSAAGFYFDVINISMGHNYYANDITNPSPTDVSKAFISDAPWTNYISKSIDGTYAIGFGAAGSANIYLTDAVVTKAAGNDSIVTGDDPLSYVMAYDPKIAPRLLLVGALDSDGKADPNGGQGTAKLASYSNQAGTDPNIQNRFLVASGLTPYISSGMAVDGANVSSGVGTSYAAPRVAGYAAILRQKFLNLTAASTANILLATARMDTLSCYSTAAGCPKDIYGQGEACLSRALAPVGYLR